MTARQARLRRRKDQTGSLKCSRYGEQIKKTENIIWRSLGYYISGLDIREKRIKLLSKILSEGTANFTFSFVYERIQLLGAFTRGYDGQPYSRGSLAIFCKNEKPGGNMRKNLHIRLNLSILRVTERRMKQEGKADGGKGHD